MKIAVIGTGTMGIGITQVLAEGNYEVILYGRRKEGLENAIKKITKILDKKIEKSKINKLEKEEILNKIKFVDDIREVKNCNFVIEAISENMEIKKDIFKSLDELCPPEVIIATNTSSLSITELAMVTSRPEKVIGIHFFNPVPVMQLVEIIDGITTSDETRNKVIELVESINKTYVLVNEAPGFIVNRMLIPMINEAIGIFAEGIATKEDIDNAMKLGANHPIGPLALADLIGNDVCLAIMEVLHEEFSDSKYRPHPLLKKMVRGGKLGRKTKSGFYEYN